MFYLLIFNKYVYVFFLVEIVNSVNKSWENDFQSKSKAMKGKFKNKKNGFNAPIKTIQGNILTTCN